ncbi:MAG: hypothetical protein AAF721_09080 [Myxococcota bacterium]
MKISLSSTARVAALVAGLLVGCAAPDDTTSLSFGPDGPAPQGTEDGGDDDGAPDDGDGNSVDDGDDAGPQDGPGDDAPPSDGDDDGADTATSDDGAAVHDPQPFGCITSVNAGTQEFDCDGLVTTVTVPSNCLDAPCGVVLDIHGASMDANQQDKNTNLRAIGSEHGYAVVQPSTDGFSWSAGHEDRIMTGLFDVMEALGADRDRIHVTGFSAGAGATWVILCEYPEVFASAAPAAATGQYLGAAPVCFGTSAPFPEFDLLYMNGETDPFETMDYVNQLVGKIILDWTMGAGTVVEGDAMYQRLRHENGNGTAFELLTHTYETDESVGVPPLGADLAGHCFPGSTDHNATLPGQLAGYGCKGSNGFHFGELVMQFFVDNPK